MAQTETRLFQLGPCRVPVLGHAPHRSSRTIGALRPRRLMVMTPAFSSCIRARYFTLRPIPYSASTSFETTTVLDPVLRVSCASHNHTIALTVLVAAAAFAAQVNGNMANGSAFRR